MSDLKTAVVVFDEEGAGYVSGINGAGMDVDWHMCQEHINDAVTEGVPGAEKWKAIRMIEFRPFTEAELDYHLDQVLQASGSGLKHYSMQKTKEDMRAALKAAIQGMVNR